MASIRILTSTGTFAIHSETGVVINDKIPKGYRDITQFDIKEHCFYWGLSEFPKAINIKNIGYWDRFGKFVKPDDEWRQRMSQKA